MIVLKIFLVYVSVGIIYGSLQYSKQCSYSKCTLVHMLNLMPSKCICNKYKSTVDHIWIGRIDLVKSIGIDQVNDNRRRLVLNSIFSISFPAPLRSNPQLAVTSKDALVNLLDLDPSCLYEDERFLDILSGKSTVVKSVSHRYGGYQFGYWAGQLGDGRAHILGSYKNRKGDIWELQLKGSGQTPFSRDGDGRAVLRSSIREFLASEAMYFLGIPTSRAATLVVSDDKTIRDQFYDGNIARERCAIVLRLARSWLRFGSFDMMHKNGEKALMKRVTDKTIQTFFHQINITDEDRYVQFLWEVSDLTARLIAKWTSVGFAHGVINTDNLSILGITIDYGPFGFVESYDPKFIPNTSDDEGRYRLDNQANAALFNLNRLSEALMTLYIPGSPYIEQLKRVVAQFGRLYHSYMTAEFAEKLGFTEVLEGMEQLIAIILHIMENRKADFTMTFRELSEASLSQLSPNTLPGHFWALKSIVSHEMFPDFITLYKRFLRTSNIKDYSRQQVMRNTNPRYILRNWIAEKAIVAAGKNDFSILHRLEKIFRNPFRKQKEAEDLGLASPPPTWANTLKVSCSS